MIDIEFVGDSRPIRKERSCAGHHFYPNGDLLVAYHVPKKNLILCKVFGFRDGVQCMVDSWCEDRCKSCGCSRGHAAACKKGNKI